MSAEKPELGTRKPQHWRDAINLCYSTANRAPDERTAQHWRDVAALLEGDLLAAKVRQALPPSPQQVSGRRDAAGLEQKKAGLASQGVDLQTPSLNADFKHSSLSNERPESLPPSQEVAPQYGSNSMTFGGESLKQASSPTIGAESQPVANRRSTSGVSAPVLSGESGAGTLREKFEKWLGGSKPTVLNNQYLSPSTELAWLAWEASARAARKECAEIARRHYHLNCAFEIAAAIERLED